MGTQHNFWDQPQEPELMRQFKAYHEKNPEVYKLFCHFTREAIDAGRKHFGAKAIWERMRWYTSIETRCPSKLKLCNTWTAFYARLFMFDHPVHAGFFRTKHSAADRGDFRLQGDGRKVG